MSLKLILVDGSIKSKLIRADNELALNLIGIISTKCDQMIRKCVDIKGLNLITLWIVGKINFR